MRQKNGLHSFGYISAESELIWKKSGTVWARCWGWPWQILGTISTVTTVWQGGEIFLSGKKRTISPISRRKHLRHFNTSTSIGVPVKTFGTKFWKFYYKGSFFQKTQKLLTKFPGLATSGRHKQCWKVFKYINT